MRVYPRRLRRADAALHVEEPLPGTAIYHGDWGIPEIVDHMAGPLLGSMRRSLARQGHACLAELVPNWFVLKLGIGMLRPHCIDDLWDPDALAFNPMMKRLLKQEDYYAINRLARPPIGPLLRATTGGGALPGIQAGR